ncbi:MAG: hypothetical protein ACLFS1_08990 [Opitutales bacterium]
MILSFDTDFGTFRIEPASPNGKTYRLDLVSHSDAKKLGEFSSINNAILAVVQQKTSLPEWDTLCLQDLPYRVFDITCWNFSDFSGTTAAHACS